MRGKRWSFATVGVLACVVAACAEDEGLTPDEADAIVNRVVTAYGAFPLPTFREGGFQYYFTKYCRMHGGWGADEGSIRMTGRGEIRATVGGREYELEGTNEFADCSHEEDGVALTLVSGVVAHRILVVFESSDDRATEEVDWSGDVTVETGSGYSGYCQVQLSLRLAVDEDPASGSTSVEGVITGTVCDRPVELDVTEFGSMVG